MNRVTIKQLQSASTHKLKEWMPCEITSDGEVIAQIVPHRSQLVPLTLKAYLGGTQAGMTQAGSLAKILPPIPINTVQDVKAWAKRQGYSKSAQLGKK